MSYRIKPLFNWYSFSGSYLKMRFAIILLLATVSIGIFGFVRLEDYTLTEAFYMTVITISTVGYGEVKPLSPDGQLFTSIYILFNVGVFAYTVSAFTNFVIQGELFKKMHTNTIESKIKELDQHIILCGYGRHGQEVADHFINHKIEFVVIEKDPEKVERIQKSEQRILYVEGDGTEDKILQQAGIDRASCVICSFSTDRDNVFAVLTARQLNPRLRIISRATHPETEKKLSLAGADHVIMPEQIGGFYMATLVSKPGAVEFFSFIANEYESDIGFEEIHYDRLPTNLQGKNIREMNVRDKTGVNIISFKSPEGHYEVNPSPDCKLVPGSSFIVLGSRKQLEKLRVFMKK